MFFVLAAMAGAPPARADMSPPASGPAPGVTPEEQAREAGSAAGFAAECGADTAAIHGAFEGYLTRQGLGDGEREALGEQFSRAGTPTVASLEKGPAPPCAEMHERGLKAVPRLRGGGGVGSASEGGEWSKGWETRGWPGCADHDD